MKRIHKKIVAHSIAFVMMFNAFMPTIIAQTSVSVSKKAQKAKKQFPTVDYIIVGAGTAGLTAAWALTNDKKTSVLVLEAGEDLTADPAVLTPNIFQSFDDLTYDPKYAWVDTTTNKTQRLNYTSGRMIGGSSAHNYLQAMRGTPEAYDDWAAITGNPAWSYAGLLELFKSQEHYFANGNMPDTQQRGLNGRLYISQQDPVVPGTNRLYDAVAEAYQVPFITDYNDHYEISPGVFANILGISANQQWTTDYCASQTCGIRSFSGNSYLKGIPAQVTKDNSSVDPLVNADNNGINCRKLFVRTNSFVSRVLFQDTRAVGVEVIINENNINKTCKIKAKKGVILAAGPVRSPALLQLSGIGKSSDLVPLGIPVLIDNPNVGYNAQNQYAVDVLIKKRADSPLSPVLITPCWSDVRFPQDEPTDGTRKCLTNVASGAFLPSIVLGTIGIAPSDAFVNYTNLLSFLLNTKSRGSVIIQSPDPLTPPYVNLNMFSDTDGPNGTSQDLADCVKLYKLGQIVAEKYGVGPEGVAYPLNDHYPSPWGPAPDDKLLELDAQLQPQKSDHLTSTCQMSSTPATGVVDGKLKVWETENLYVADNSIQPRPVTASPAYVAFFIGLNLAKFLGAQLP